MHRTTFEDFDICQRMIPMAKVTPNDADILFKGKQFEILISQKHVTDFKYLATFQFSKVQMKTKLFLQICLHFCDTDR